jgi:hypothetical protein
MSITKVISKLLEFFLSIKTPFGIHNLRYMDKAKSSETGYSRNMLDFPVNKEERVLAHILETKFHIDLAIDSVGSQVESHYEGFSHQQASR